MIDAKLVRKMDRHRVATPAFKEFFAEPFYYADVYGYALDGLTFSKDQALEIFFKKFTDNLVPEVHKYVRYYLRNNIKESYVKWHGYIDDDGQMSNGWVISDDYYKKRASKRVWRVSRDDHYFRTGHEFQPIIDVQGYARWGSSYDRDCNVCTEVKLLQDKLGEKVLERTK